MKQKQYLDVHGLTLNQAIITIKQAVLLAYQQMVPILYINHGFNNGNKIKSWCLKEGKKIKNVLKVESGDNEGISKFYICLNYKKLLKN